MWSAFPTSDYYGTSATSTRPQATLTLLPHAHAPHTAISGASDKAAQMTSKRFERAHFVDQEQRARAARFSAALYLHPVVDDRFAQRIGREVRELACQPAHEAFPRRSGPRSRRNKSGSRAQQGGRCCYNLE